MRSDPLADLFAARLVQMSISDKKKKKKKIDRECYVKSILLTERASCVNNRASLHTSY